MTEMLVVPIEDIYLGDNARVQTPSDEDDADLTRSVRATGIIQPLVVRRDGHHRYRLVVGHRRHAAAVEAGLRTVPVLVDPPGEPSDTALQLIENTHRAPMDPMDVSRAVVAILNAEPDLTQEQLARRMGRSPSWVSDALKKARRDPRTQRDIARGRIKGRAASLMLNRSQSERRQLIEMPEGKGELRRVVTRPSVRTMNVPALDGWSAELSWDGSDTARLDIKAGATFEAGIRLDTQQARRLARALRLLCDAMDATLVGT